MHRNINSPVGIVDVDAIVEVVVVEVIVVDVVEAEVVILSELLMHSMDARHININTISTKFPLVYINSTVK